MKHSLNKAIGCKTHNETDRTPDKNTDPEMLIDQSQIKTCAEYVVVPVDPMWTLFQCNVALADSLPRPLLNKATLM